MKKNRTLHKSNHQTQYHIANINFQNLLRIAEKANRFENVIDEKITQFEQQGINISTCPEYFENMVDEHILKLLGQLEAEYINNMCFIGSCFRKRASIKIEYQKHIDQLDLEIATTEAEYELIRKLAEDLNPLKHGKLTAEKNLSSQKKEEDDE